MVRQRLLVLSDGMAVVLLLFALWCWTCVSIRAHTTHVVVSEMCEPSLPQAARRHHSPAMCVYVCIYVLTICIDGGGGDCTREAKNGQCNVCSECSRCGCVDVWGTRFLYRVCIAFLNLAFLFGFLAFVADMLRGVVPSIACIHMRTYTYTYTYINTHTHTHGC